MKPFRGSHVSVEVAVSPERLQLAQVSVLVEGATQMMGGLIALCAPMRPSRLFQSSSVLRQMLGVCGLQVARHRSHQVQLSVSGGGVSQKMIGVRSAVRWQCETLAMIVLLGAVLVVGETCVGDKVAWRDRRRRARAFALAGAAIPIAADLLCLI